MAGSGSDFFVKIWALANPSPASLSGLDQWWARDYSGLRHDVGPNVVCLRVWSRDGQPSVLVLDVGRKDGFIFMNII